MDSQAVKQIARELGFALCGVAAAAPTVHRQHVLDWLAAGRHGSMRWLAEHVDLRMNPRELLPEARSVICVADQIGPGSQENVTAGERGGRIARYAQLDDYHKVLKKRLHEMADRLRDNWPGEMFRVCVDTAPVLERDVHQRAGLGWVGKNTMLIHPFRGSHLLLGEIITTAALEPDSPEPDHCGACTRCIEACPTQCITPYEVDASRCISYLTIEHRERIDPALHEAMGDWLYGCDVCQEVCPYNNPQRAQVSEGPTAQYGPPRPAVLDALAVLNWTEEDRRAAFTRSAMKRAKLNAMKRNALIVLGNTVDRWADDSQVMHRIRQVAHDAQEDPLVRDTAHQVLARLEVDALQRR